MRIIVVGAGVVGVTSAWYLAQAGHDVVVLDSLAGSAQGASHANGGLLSVGHSAPTAAPGMVSTVLKSFFQKDSPIQMRPDFTWHQVRWLLQTLGQCTKDNFAKNQKQMIYISQLTRQCLHQLQEETGIEFEGRQGGILQLCVNQEQIDAAKKQAAALSRFNIRADLLDAQEVFAIEPGLQNSKNAILGGLRLVDEESGDCELFTRRLEQMLLKKGVQFHYGVRVKELSCKGERVDALVTDSATFTADAYVIATGASIYKLLKPIVNVPVYPVKGCSLTLPVLESKRATQYVVFDLLSSVAISRFDQRVRVAGFAGIMGFDDRINSSHVEFLKKSYEGWFPESVNLDDCSPWVGFRPMTPDGTPIISKTPMSNLYVNAGHGTYGWTMSCGSAQMLTQIIEGQVSDSQVQGYSLKRY